MPTGVYVRTQEMIKKVIEGRKGYTHSEETKKKISEGNKHRAPITSETRQKMSDAKKGKTPWNKGKKCPQFSGKNNPYYGKHPSEETRRKISEASKRRKVSLATRKKHSDARKGVDIPYDTRVKISDVQIGHWYGNVRYYYGKQYCELWTEFLKERSRMWYGYCCVVCGTPQSALKYKLHVHHVWDNKNLCCDSSPRSLVPLCGSCHSIIKARKNKLMWANFFQYIIDSYYDGKCWLTKEEYIEYTNI